MRWFRPVLVTGIFAGGLIASGAWAASDSECEAVAGSVRSAEGSVQVQRGRSGGWGEAPVGTTLCEGDTVRTGMNSRAAIALVNESVFRLDQNTAVLLADIAPEPAEKSFVDLLVGALQSFSRKPREVAINTPYLNATIEGTEFVIRVAQNQTELSVFEGTVRAANPQGQEAVSSGQVVVAQAGGAPQRRTVVRPRDAAQWSIYYPPVLSLQDGDVPSGLRRAASLAAGGDAAAALALLDSQPAEQQGGDYHLYRASFLLAAGQVGAARGAIDRALQLNSGSAQAYALRSVIDTAQNRREDALANGQRAVELAPGSAAAAIALSYALQAEYRLGEARQAVEAAVAANPDDALARARLAELWMMVGYRDRARAEAEKAAELAPNTSRAQSVLGFAALVEMRTGAARAAFTRAIELDSDDPMPHLGLGLARIRAGDLAAGRAEIEAAVALDPESALLRSYLGKAYFEEKRVGIDAQQLDIAKEQDPNDPTAYLYDALRKQSENRPGEALADLQKSIELNDNRAVYRGRMQLDEDRAARGASLANVYSDLGFTRMGLNEATKSLNDDPTNASAHRFLSDTYAGMRRHEIARVSEQLQAQMLQDININPVSPSGSTANLTSSGGFGTAGLNEYSALFERNQMQLDLSGSYGMDETSSGEAIASAVLDRFSLSAGAYHYETQGWRENSGIEHDIQNVYAQAALTPDLNLQLEYRHRESASGDLAMRFDPNDYSAVFQSEIDQDIWRAGVRYSPTPNSDILVSYIGSQRELTTVDQEVQDFTFFTLDVGVTDVFDDEGSQYEAQYLYRSSGLDMTLGGAFSNVVRDRVRTDVLLTDFPGFFFVPPIAAGTVLTLTTPYEDIDHARGYLYLNGTYPASVTWTAGVSYDDLSRVGGEVKEWNPKLGVQWDVTQNLRFRGAAFQVVKPMIVANRTVEPTQVAGFNQMFDDTNGTVSRAYGLGVDWHAGSKFALGVEGMARKFDEIIGVINIATDPTALPGTGVFQISDPIGREERIVRAYASWMPASAVAVTLEGVHDWYSSEAGVADGLFPSEIETISVPLAVRYFHPSGFGLNLGATYVNQDVQRHATSTMAAGNDSFVSVDAGVGWKLPNRSGRVSLQARNLLDAEFNYQDDGFREFSEDPGSSPFVPARTVVGTLALRF